MQLEVYLFAGKRYFGVGWALDRSKVDGAGGWISKK